MRVYLLFSFLFLCALGACSEGAKQTTDAGDAADGGEIPDGDADDGGGDVEAPDGDGEQPDAEVDGGQTPDGDEASDGGEVLDGGDEGVDGGGDSSDGDASDGDNPADDGGIECVSEVSLPVEYGTLTGFSGSEDFAFDSDGTLVSTRDRHLIRQTKDGSSTIFVPNLGETAGMAFLPDGDLVVALMDDYSLHRVYRNGSTQVILSNLEYPNGMEVDMQGLIYVSEMDAGRIRQIDPDTGDYTIIAQGMDKPNGLSFDPQYQTLFVVSFGGGTVHAIDRISKQEFAEPRLFAHTPGAPAAACFNLSEGDECVDSDGVAGICEDIGFGHLYCRAEGLGSCAGLEDGDPCRLANWLPGTCEVWWFISECVENSVIPEKYREACQNLAEGDSCSILIDGVSRTGICVQHDWNNLLCLAGGEPDYDAACEGLQEDDPCQVNDYGEIKDGKCVEKFDGTGLTCWVLSLEDFHGGLDGLEIDACGYVYVTEYLVGTIWRITQDGSQVEELFSPDSTWIPNLHFGSGLGGWDTHTLYVMDRDLGRVFETQLDVEGKPCPYP